MKLTEQEKQDKIARSNIKKLVNRVSSEFAFKKWRSYHDYLHSMGYDESFIKTQGNVELNRQQLDELLSKYEDEAIRQLTKIVEKPAEVIHSDKPKDTGDIQLPSVRVDSQSNTVQEEKFTEKNNYGLSKSQKESITLFWFQRKAAAELLKGFI